VMSYKLRSGENSWLIYSSIRSLKLIEASAHVYKGRI